jgi:hypothetical protein
MAYRSENDNNVEAHVNGPKKEHDGNHGKDYGKGHSEQAREGAHQSRSATPGRAPGMQPQIVQAPSSRGGCEKKTGIQIAALARHIHQYCRATPEQSEAKGGVPAPEDMDAIANRRRAEKIQRLGSSTARWTSQAYRRGNEHSKSKR